MTATPDPTDRELEILKVLWDRGEATVREVYAALRDRIPIVQATVQAFLRTMEQKGLVAHRVDGRSFIYRATAARRGTTKHLVSDLLDRVFDGAVDQLVEHALAVRPPRAEEMQRLRELLAEAEARSQRAEDEPR